MTYDIEGIENADFGFDLYIYNSYKIAKQDNFEKLGYLEINTIIDHENEREIHKIYLDYNIIYVGAHILIV